MKPSRFPSAALRSFALAALALSSASLFAQSIRADLPVRSLENPQYMVAPDHIVVQFQPGVTTTQISAYARRYQMEVDTKRSSPYGYFVVLKLNAALRNAGVHPGYMARQMNSLLAVKYAEEDGVVTPDYIPNDTRFADCWHLNNTGQGGGTPDADIDAPEGWDAMGTLPEVTVAILDDGVDIHHEDMVDSLWVNPGEIPDNGIDDDGNGFIDDVHGWDFIDNDNDPTAGSHGTHCAGIAGATHNNGKGVSGVGPNIRIMAVRFYPGPSYFSDLATAIDYAWQNGAQVISVSYNIDGYNNTFRQAVIRSAQADACYVGSAGNNGQQDPPRQVLRTESDNVVFVVSTNNRDRKSGFSNWGSLIEVGAPGENILSLLPGNGYVYNSGTSMATPLAAGILAMIRAAEPAFTAREALDALISTCDSVDTLTQYIADGKRVNLANAMTGITPPSGGAPLSVALVMGTQTGGNLNSFLASDDDYYEVTTQYYTDRGQYAVFDLTFNGGKPSTDVKRIRLTFESAGTQSGVSEFVQMYNWTTGTWDVIESTRLSQVDFERVIEISHKKVGNYVNPNDETVKVRCQAFLPLRSRGITPGANIYRVDHADLKVQG